MKISLFYFSGTGNTWYISEALQKALTDLGHRANAISIEDIDTDSAFEMIKQSDHIIIGYPIYGSKAPRIMESFIDHLKPLDINIPTSIFTTVALYSGDGPIAYRDILKAKGYQLHTTKEFIMNNNFNVPGFPDVLHVGDTDKIEKRHKKSKEKVLIMATAIDNNHPSLQGDAIHHKLMGSLQRRHVDSYIHTFNQQLKVVDTLCIHCQKCVKICPVNNIKSIDGKITIENHCMACIRCYHLCPTKAINVTDKSLDTKKWPRFSGIYKNFEKSLLK